MLSFNWTHGNVIVTTKAAIANGLLQTFCNQFPTI
jgi:hypothetical protein